MAPMSGDGGGDAPAYSAETNGVVVEVDPFYLPDESDPEDDRYVWGYRVRVTNRRGEAVQLVSRYWRIIDARGAEQEVRGEGVVGAQPTIPPGGTFEYVSGAPLQTPSGMMGGTYALRAEDGAALEAVIPTFSLDSPHAARVLN